MATLNSKEIKKRSKAKGDDGEGLYVRGRTHCRDSRQSNGKSRSKSRGERLKCYIFQSYDHLKRNCPKNNQKKSTSYVKKDDHPSSSGSTYDDSELDKLFDFLECDEGSVLLGDNMECKIRGIGKSGKVKVINGSRVVLSGTRKDNCVYSLDGHAVAGELKASVEEKDSLAQVWHKRLGHISEAGLQVLEKHRLFGKKSLELWGLSQVESLGGKRYFLSIVDDYSRRLVENQTGRTVKKLRADNGLEFRNREFKQLRVKSRIARQLTVTGTPQQNGLAEHMNRTLMDKTPMKMWSGHPCNYEMLKIFGCVAYSHVKQGKLKPRAIKCVLLGYPEGVKGYRLYRLDDESPKIVTIMNVVFNERCHTPRQGLDGIRIRRRDVITHLKYKA
nr:retrovirus-related Pol polyprotein from transposon TNT 1-94 [Tanacetum cinerariifolium]